MTRISAIIPTHNRPDLLREAVESVVRQTYPAFEIVVVDDGSQPRVDAARLQAEFGRSVRVVRNDPAQGLAWVRDQGVQAAKGELIVHLDDDDRLAPGTLEMGVALFDEDPELEVVFLGVEGFGSQPSHFNQVQPEATRRVIERSDGVEIAPGVVQLGPRLMAALLLSVPQAFQHVLVRLTAWDAVSALRRRAYSLDADTPDEETAMRRIKGPLRDSEWALYAGALCRKTLLMNKPCYLFRCDGQSYTSQPENRERHVMQGLAIKSQLFRASRSFAELDPWQRPIRESVATAEFDAAYHFAHHGQRIRAWHYLRAAFLLQPRLSHLRLAMRLLLPRGVDAAA